MEKIKINLKTTPHQKQGNIIQKPVSEITQKNQQKGQLDIVREKEPVKLPVGIAYVHIDHSI